MTEVLWAAQRGRPATPVVPRDRVYPKSATAPSPWRVPPPVVVSPFGISFTFGGRYPRSPRKRPASMATMMPAVIVSSAAIDLSYGDAPPKLPTIMGIIREVAAEHGLTVEAITGECRTRHYVVARQHAMWRCAQEQRWSLTRIGKAFKKDHTTVLHGVRRHAERLAKAREAEAV